MSSSAGGAAAAEDATAAAAATWQQQSSSWNFYTAHAVFHARHPFLAPLTALPCRIARLACPACSAGPGPEDLSTVAYTYTSSVDLVSHPNAGLIGVLVVAAPGSLRCAQAGIACCLAGTISSGSLMKGFLFSDEPMKQQTYTC